MKIKIRTTDDQLVVYREKTGVILYALFLAVSCIAFGVTFLYLGKEETFPLLFSSVFVIGGVLLLASLPKYYRTMKNTDGAVLLNATKEGLSIAPLLNMPLVQYAWADISRVVLTKKLITKQTGEKGYNWNQAMIFFRRSDSTDDLSVLERSKRQIWKSPKGSNVSIIDLGKDNIAQVEEALLQLAVKICEISSCRRVEFDYVTNTEEFKPE